MNKPSDPDFSNVVQWILEPLEAAFKPSEGGLPADYNQFSVYRNAFSEPGDLMMFGNSDNNSWQSRFGTLRELLYTHENQTKRGLYGNLKSKILSSFDELISIRRKVRMMPEQMRYESAWGIDNAKSCLQAYTETVRLDMWMKDTSKVMSANNEALRTTIKDVRHLIWLLRQNWIDCAKEIGKDKKTSKLRLNRDDNYFFSHLRTWSAILDDVDNAMLLCDMTSERHTTLCEYFKMMPSLGKLAELHCDLYGNLTTGTPDFVEGSITAIQSETKSMSEWFSAMSKTFPSTAHQSFSFRQQGMSGRTKFEPRNNDAKSLNIWAGKNMPTLPRRDDFQIGVSVLDFDKWCSLEWELDEDKRCWVRPSAPGKGYWNARADRFSSDGSRKMYSMTSSFISVPLGSFRDGPHFSWARLRREPQTGQFVVEAPGMAPYKKNAITMTEGNERVFEWEIQFPPRQFPQKDYSVHPWIMDLSQSSAQIGRGGLIISTSAFNASSFVLKIKWPHEVVDFDKLKIGYLIYADACNPYDKGLYCKRLDTKLDYPQRTNNDNYTATLWQFPKDMFKRTPAIATMLRSFIIDLNKNPRVGIDFAASRDAIVLRSYAWADTEMHESEWEVLAIRSELESPGERDGEKSIIIS